MKSVMMLMAVALVLVTPAAVQNANAQLELTMGGGVNAPLGEYGDQAKTGYALTGGLGYRIMPLAVIGVEASYNGNGATDDATATLGSGYDLSSSILQYSAMAKLMLPVGIHNVFVKGSVGNYRGSAKLSGPLGSASIANTELGYGLGAGFLINSAANSSFFADFTYHQVSYEEGTDSNFYTITVGAVFKFDLFNKSSLRDDLQDDIDQLKN